MNEIKLKPCPFCGGRANVIMERCAENKYSISVKCSKCSVKTSSYTADLLIKESALKSISDCVDLAVKKWNGRVDGD